MDLSAAKGINLDIGCGENKQKGFVGMDRRDVEGVDIVWDIEDFPWPLEAESCLSVVGSHILEHIKPWYSVDLMNETWRILKVDAAAAFVMPYPGSRGFWQDPTHCNGWNEVTWQYFDPDYPLYMIYKPKPFKIEFGFPVWQANGNIEVMMRKVPELKPGWDKIPEKSEFSGLGDLSVKVADKLPTAEALK